MLPVIILSVCTGWRHGTIVTSLYPEFLVQLSQRGAILGMRLYDYSLSADGGPRRSRAMRIACERFSTPSFA